MVNFVLRVNLCLMLRVVTYLSPSIPRGFYELVAADLGAELRFEEAISGPLEGDDEPFSRGLADVGFVCAPSYRFLNAGSRVVDLLPLPVPLDGRAVGRPFYYADVVVRADSSISTFEDLRGLRWSYNDRNSKSGWFSMLGRVAPGAAETFFTALIHSGSHLRSLDLVAAGAVDAAAIDSNVLALNRGLHPELRVLESWGPFPIQPAIVRAALPAAEKSRIANALLTIHERHTESLERFGVTRFVNGDEAAYA
jgi:phosphonate transport system substrate-binding protein